MLTAGAVKVWPANSAIPKDMPMVYQQKSENSLDNTLKNDFIVLIINST